MVDWTQVLVALAVGLPATLTALGAVWLSWNNSAKLDSGIKKLDVNTELTKDGTRSAAASAKAAVSAAISAKSATEDLSRQMNGALDDRISRIVKEHTGELAKAFKEHNEQDERNMVELKQLLAELKQASKPQGR